MEQNTLDATLLGNGLESKITRAFIWVNGNKSMMPGLLKNVYLCVIESVSGSV